MPASRKNNNPLLPHVWDGVEIAPGQATQTTFAVTESYSGMTITVPVYVIRGRQSGPAVFVTAAIHGDEINGTGAIRSLIYDQSLSLERGVLILVPVVNMLGFDRHSRYLPDRRDLNRCFPGSATGSLARRMARLIFEQIVGRCNYGIDVHTASVRRTNFPNIRADMSDPEVARIARAFGCELILNSRGPAGSLRKEATSAGCPTIVLEAGEVWKVEPTVVDYTIRGVLSILGELEMTDNRPRRPKLQVQIDKTRWIRAERGGFLRFHVSPGEMVERGQPLATNTDLLGTEQNVLAAPFDAIVVGMTTLPSITPGDPVCNLGEIVTSQKEFSELRRRLKSNPLHGRMRDDLSTNVVIADRNDIASNENTE